MDIGVLKRDTMDNSIEELKNMKKSDLITLILLNKKAIKERDAKIERMSYLLEERKIE